MSDYYWTTEYYHPNNSYTMEDYLTNHLYIDYDIIYVDGSYAEIIDNNGTVYKLYAGGNGDSYNHKITINKIN